MYNLVRLFVIGTLLVYGGKVIEDQKTASATDNTTTEQTTDPSWTPPRPGIVERACKAEGATGWQLEQCIEIKSTNRSHWERPTQEPKETTNPFEGLGPYEQMGEVLAPIQDLVRINMINNLHQGLGY